MGILAAREISRFKGIGLYRTTSVVSISKLPPFVPFVSPSPPYPSEETILLLFRPRDLGYFVTPDRVDASVSLPFSRPSNRRIARSRYSTSFSTNVTRNAISYHRHHRHIPDNYSLSSISIFHILRVNTETVSIIYRTL